MLLLQALTASVFNSLEALIELSCREVFIILATSLLVFFPFLATNGCRSEKVVNWQSGLSQNILLVFTSNTGFYCEEEDPVSHVDRQNELLKMAYHSMDKYTFHYLK